MLHEVVTDMADRNSRCVAFEEADLCARPVAYLPLRSGLLIAVAMHMRRTRRSSHDTVRAPHHPDCDDATGP
jgi:hypothetical protein